MLVLAQPTAPAAGVPVGGIWTAAITAAALLIGILITNFLQNRREARNWRRERERDAEQRADQRRRDHELWSREDKHRFAEHKRDLYAEVLADLDRRGTSMYCFAQALKWQNEHIAKTGGEPIQNVEDWGRERGEDLVHLRLPDSNLQSRVRLVAPIEVHGKLHQIIGRIVATQALLLIDNDPLTTLKVYEVYMHECIELKDAMSTDLNTAADNISRDS